MTALSSDPRIFIDHDRFPKMETRMVAEASTFLRRGPKSSSAAETELLYGTLFHIHRQGRGWVWGQAESPLPGCHYPGYVGWVRSRHLSLNGGKKSHKIRALSAPVFKKPDIKSQVVCHLPLSATITGYARDSFIEISLGFIHERHVLALSETPDYPDWVNVAESLLGQPYVWGGISNMGLDCSGLVQTALRVMGSDIPRDTDQQAQIGQSIRFKDDLSGFKRGDLIFWKGHVGIMRSPTELLHANAYHMAVASEPLAMAIERIGKVTAIRRLAD